ncbi:MAG TPA: hypothetical protein VF712_06775 [Thermoleophilaceae bacterium]
MPRAELCAGPVGLLDGRIAPAADVPTLRLEVPAVEPAVPANTIHLRFDDRPAPFRLIGRDGDVLATGVTTTAALFGGMSGCPGSLPELEPFVGPELRAAPWSPILYASWDGEPERVHTHGQARVSTHDVLLVRNSPEPVPYDRWVMHGAANHARDPVFLNNHQCYYRKVRPGQETEHKFTFEEPGAVDVWALIVAVYDELRAARLPGFIMEYGDEFQRWDYENHLFEVVDPPEERGYISFIPRTDGRHNMKRKWYEADALTRREEQYSGIDLTGSFEETIGARFDGLELRRLPSFRRVRYDVNLESVRTGHVYGIFFDHCPLLEDPSVALSQCEVEYLRTRSVLPPDEEAVFPELQVVADWTAALLDRRGARYRRDFYSKLSFLRDVVGGGQAVGARS